MPTGSLKALPGWWGKLPGTGDFSHRRLADGELALLDDWLQTELGALRLRHPSWQTAYLGAPIWHFVLGAGLLGSDEVLGLLMPSVDRVGRYFPLLIVQTTSEARAGGAGPASWWRLVTEAALQALREDRDPQGLDDALAMQFAMASRGEPESDHHRLAEPGWSQWRNSSVMGAPFQCGGLPRGPHFDLLFDLAGLPAAGGLAP